MASPGLAEFYFSEIWAGGVQVGALISCYKIFIWGIVWAAKPSTQYPNLTTFEYSRCR
jgi:hypothetical protein